jgi:glycosyltransferase involved in cell wall biosynthesis
MSGRIAILLATYNGEKYLDDQMGSLFAQTYSDFIVIVRDDCSNDRTPEILARWAASYPDKIKIVSDDRGNLRSIKNFGRLMEVCDTPYFAFCDQDDVWLPNKIELAVNEVRRLESQFGQATPVLVHSDLKVVDGDLREIAPSFFRYSHIDLGKAERLDHMLINNVVQGCASVGNRSLLELALPIPDGVPYHDWWVALLATSCGVMRTIREPTILWRQHGRNQAGAGNRQRRSTLWDARHILQQPKLLKVRMAKAMMIIQSQASELLRVAGDKMPHRNREFLRAFCLPRRRSEAPLLPWVQRTRLFARFLIVYARSLPLALRWCF